jgi:ribosomal-protein-alanine N-acetyltransferase
MPTELRPYTPQDFDTLYEIDRQCFQPSVSYSRRDLKHYLHFPGADCILAEVNGRPAGFCLSAREDDFGYIITMDVLPEFRRQGVAALLLAQAESKLSENGVREVGLETATDNDAAVLFWTKHGYRTRGVRKNYYPGNVDAFSMTKILPQPPNSEA